MPDRREATRPTPPADRSGRWPDRDRNAEGRPENARPRDRFGAPLPRGAVDELADRVEPETVCRTVADAVTTAADLFDQQRFFEAHEFLEWAWKGPTTDDADRQLFKGLAQVAVGYTHTQRGNAKGARTLLQRGVGNVSPYLPAAHGVDLARLVADAEAFQALLGTTKPGPDLPFPRWPSAG